MSSQHSLALPLSADYAINTREEFSFFCTQSTPDDSVSAAPAHDTGNPLDRYLDDLCAFLRSSRLIQAHPDNYFQFIRGESWAASPVHFDNSPVEAEELAHTQTLLRAFRPLLQGDDAMHKLRALVRDGPPMELAPLADPIIEGEGAEEASDAPLALLQTFYRATRSLMLGRARRSANDTASLTLLTEAERLASNCDAPRTKAQRQRERDILDLVVSHGMNPKKQHEVRIMRETIRDLVFCCNAGVGDKASTQLQSSGPQSPPSSETAKRCHGDVFRVETAINIGEGKGYVSRALALCDHLQVVGLDCNPAHKERAVERFESILETSLAARDGKPRINMMYEARGHMASIACRIDERVDWASLLHGHVQTCADPCMSPVGSSGGDTSAFPLTVKENQNALRDDDMVAVTRLCDGEALKLACRVCGKVVRQKSTAVVMKHIYAHLQSHGRSSHFPERGVTTQASTSPAPLRLRIPTLEEVREWNVSLSQQAYVARLTEIFFTVTDIEEQHHANRKNAALLKRVRVDDKEVSSDVEDRCIESTPGYLTLVSASHSHNLCDENSREQSQPSTQGSTSITLEPAYTARGFRVVLLVAELKKISSEPPLIPLAGVSRVAAAADQSEAATLSRSEQHSSQAVGLACVPPDIQSPELWSYTQVIATVVGYDGGADKHLIYINQENKRRTLRLYRLPPKVSATAQGGNSDPTALYAEGSAALGNWLLPDPKTWGREGVALVLSVLPPVLPSIPAVCVPSLRNTVLIGLHTCGDLGSNVCRIFRNTSARGLLLVSCCWHALTPKGFPLSRALKRRGLTTTSVSFLLATQPVDAWSAASAEGHRSSARLLFYRSLFKLLWRELSGGWRARQKEAPGGHSGGCAYTGALGCGACAFPEAPPHLEPAFLRRISREKDTLTFVQFVNAVASEYIYIESAKSTPYTPWSVGQRCIACRSSQEAYVRHSLVEQRLPEIMGVTVEQDHFASFLGLTVLRMWMCHLVESLLLLDRTLYLHEELSHHAYHAAGESSAERESSAVALVPLFDGALSPRMYGILARRGGSACP